MSNISTFGTFTIARLGIYAAHKAIDIVGNNISNINTEGYTRQDIDQFSMNMGGADRYQSLLDTRVGSGAFVAGVTQMRDQFMDIRYRDEQASVGAMDGRMSGLTGIQGVLDEVGRGDDGEGVLEARFNEMITMMQELNTQGAGKDEFDSLFRASASALVNTIHSYATQLETQSEVQDLQFRQDVDQFNTVLTRIRDLNNSIRKTQVYGGNALEQQDERNLLIDELSAYTRIDVTIEKEYLGEKKYVDKLVIKTTDEPQRTLVDGIFATQVSIRQVESGQTDADGNPIMIDDPDYGLDLTELKDVNGRRLSLTTEDGGIVQIGTPLTESEGEVRKFATKEDAEDAVAELTDPDNPKTYQVVEVNDDSGSHYEIQEIGDAKYSSKEAAEAALKDVQADPDAYPAKIMENGKEYECTYEVVEKTETTGTGDEAVTTTSYEIHQNRIFHGKLQLGDIELYGMLQSEREVLTKQGVFSTEEELEKDPSAASKRGIPFYQKALDVLANTLATTLNEANVTDGKEGPLFSNNGLGDDTENINASNISISKSWANGSFKVYTSSDRETQSTANDNLNKILNLLSGSIHEFKPQGASGELNSSEDDKAFSTEVFFTGSFQELFTNHMMGSLANDIKVTNTMLNNYQIVSEELYVDRDAVHGVDLNDEAMNMMMYQKSYSAACRLMTVYDEMLDRLINGTAM